MGSKIIILLLCLVLTSCQCGNSKQYKLTKYYDWTRTDTLTIVAEEDNIPSLPYEYTILRKYGGHVKVMSKTPFTVTDSFLNGHHIYYTWIIVVPRVFEDTSYYYKGDSIK